MSASGTLGNVSTTVEGVSPTATSHPVNVYLYNTNSVNETVTLQVTPAGGAALTFVKATLAPGESLMWSGIPLGPNDTVTGFSTDAGVVNWISSSLLSGWTGPMNYQAFDANGVPKAKVIAGVGIAVNNLNATTNPKASNDNTQGYAPGSLWINTQTNQIWFCVAAATGAAIWSQATSAQNLPASQYVEASRSGTTLFAGDLTGANYNVFLNTAQAPGNVTTRTAQQMFSDIPASAVGQAFVVRIVNTGLSAMTLVAGAGLTTEGVLTIPAGFWRDFILTFTGTTTATLKTCGHGQTSRELISYPANI